MALSLAPSVVIVVAVTGLAFGAEAAQSRVMGQIRGLVGSEGAEVIRSAIKGAHWSPHSIAATLLGLAALFFGATAVVVELRQALHTIWKIPQDNICSRTRSCLNLVKERLLSFLLVLCAGLFLLASLIVNTWISAVGKELRPLAVLPQGLIQTVDWWISFVLITALFAFVFKVLPGVQLEWGDVAAGAVLTSLLFTLGKYGLGVYLGKAGFGDNYGVAGSLIVFLMWAYYSAQVVFLGAEFTRAYTLRFGSIFTAKLTSSRASAEPCLPL